MSKVRVNQITNENCNGAPTFTNGLNSSGIVTTTSTATTFSGNLTVTGNLGASGTLTYEDVSSIDSVGILTARSGVKVGPTAGVGGTFFADGSYNTAGIITATNVSVASSITAVTYFGDGSNLTGSATASGVLEHIAGQCDGSTRACNFGTFTFPNITAVPGNFNTDVYQQMIAVSYKPPAGAIGVEFNFHFSGSWRGDTHAIQHFRFYVDSNEITNARFNTSNRYYENLCSFRYYLTIGGSGNDYPVGRLENWNSAKTLEMKTRAYQANGNRVADMYGTYYWDGANSPQQFKQPQMEIISYGNPAV